MGDPEALKIHVHTDDPGAALSLGTGVGTIEGVEIADMHRQTEQREQRLLSALPGGASRSGVVAVVAGEGNRRLFEDLGAEKVIEGGQTMNPSTADLLEAVDAVAADEVVLLPNNKNVVMAAEQASRVAGKPVHVVPTESIPAGLAALVAFNGERSAEENAAAMQEAAQQVATGEVTVASRDASVDGVPVRAGNYLALLDGNAVAAGPSFDEVARSLLERLLAEPRDVLTVLTGEGAPPLNGVLDELAAEAPRPRARRARRRPAALPAPAVRRVTASMSEPIRVVLVEDNDVFREALELLLGLRSDMDVVASVSDGTGAAAVAAELRPDVVLMDYRLPGLDGVQATRAVLEACPETAVVCLTASANLRERDALTEAGAVACLSKDEGLDAIVAAIRDAARAAV